VNTTAVSVLAQWMRPTATSVRIAQLIAGA
jgi:hypothetical protein